MYSKIEPKHGAPAVLYLRLVFKSRIQFQGETVSPVEQISYADESEYTATTPSWYVTVEVSKVQQWTSTSHFFELLEIQNHPHFDCRHT